jgi:murein DD-endopeptidase MepM/ murein hydrolase activator NlpD
LVEKKDQLEYEEQVKRNLLIQTKGAEERFQTLLIELRREQEEANIEIIALERELRRKLTQEGRALGGGPLIWPVPRNTITSYFHDPDYPFRYLFEHPGIDIRASQGTPVKAASGGYVARAKGGTLAYSYVMIIHDKGLSTVYGHLSKILVEEDTYVEKGELIGYSGGLPGTPGAGRLSTGPHLHFEVRLNGTPVDPLAYLP